MTSYELATLDDRQRYAASIARAGDLLPRAFMGRPTPNPAGGMFPAQVEVGKVLLVMELGASLGIHPASALTSIYIVDGKPSLSANLMSALVRKAGHKLRVSTSGHGEGLTARAVLIRADDPDFEFVVEWTMAKAHAAGLASKDVWKKYPAAMLKSRAISEVVREGAPDVTIFAAYVPEEIGANVGEDGEPIEYQQVRESPAPTAEQPPAPPQQRHEAPIPDDPEPATEPAFDWAGAVANLSTYADALALHFQAREQGMLDLDVKQGRKKRKLGELIVEVGSALRKAEEEVVEAEVVEDGGNEAMALEGDQ